MEGTRGGMIRDGLAALPVFGPIFPRASSMGLSSGGTSLDLLAADLRTIQASAAVDRILLVMDTPGGVTTGVGEMGGLIAASPKPVTAYVAGMACSAGYWLASQAGEIVMDPSALVGSIGVIFSTSRQEGPDTSGRRTHEVVSSGAPNKRPDLSSEEGRAAMVPALDAIEAEFIGAVARGRKVSTATVRSKAWGQGGVKAGADAVEAGMADRLDTLEATLSRLARRSPPSGGSRALAERDHDMRQRRARST
ncbi:S49 family peptidase [Pararoseomonas indoligenes]|uniref:S49 family peptidase n=1 Tax=Roseomonas indoligenes TaxID=2820811 RepID=A0A940S5K3_9PROT|nr:S49 family peptidase [Pararoseomonas indoligenes]MBP0493045.1 S49 family peptidase [Pararoseomonas indoligenes]